MRLCSPTPMAEDVHTVARARGIKPEAYGRGCAECNIGFLEAPGTTLTHLKRGHDISTGSPVIVGSADLRLRPGEAATAVPGASEEFANKCANEFAVYPH